MVEVGIFLALSKFFTVPWQTDVELYGNKAGYTATLVASGWAGAVLEKATRESGQEPYAQQVAKGQYMVSDTRCPASHGCKLE